MSVPSITEEKYRAQIEAEGREVGEVHGTLNFSAEQGSPHSFVLMEDGKEGHDAMLVLRDGLYLIAFDPDGNKCWEGVINLEQLQKDPLGYRWASMFAGWAQDYDYPGREERLKETRLYRGIVLGPGRKHT